MLTTTTNLSLSQIATQHGVKPSSIVKQLRRKIEAGKLDASAINLSIPIGAPLPDEMLEAIMAIREMGSPAPSSDQDSAIVSVTAPKLKKEKEPDPFDWKSFVWTVFCRSPLPMFGLVTSHGVYKFTSMFAPSWVGLMCCTALEITYITIAFTPQKADRKRYMSYAIATAAVLTSLAYTVTSAWIHYHPDFLIEITSNQLVLYCFLYGTPPAALSFFLSLLNAEK